MLDNLNQILDCLHQLQQLPLAGRSVAFGDVTYEASCLYVCGGSQPTLYAEALGAVPEATENLQPVTQPERLNDLGWNPPLPGDDHWYRTWRAQTDAEQLSIAQQIQQTLAAAYGIRADQPLSVHFGAI